MKLFSTLAFFLFALGSSQAWAQSLERTVNRGETTVIHGGAYFVSPPPSCESKPRTYRLIRDPKLGQLSASNNNRPIKRAGGRDRSHCIGQVKEMGNLYYTAGSSVGTEQITVRTQNPNGQEVNLVFRITVQ